MFSHLKMNLSLALALRENKEEKCAGLKPLSRPGLFSPTADGLTHSVVGSVLVAHRFQELPVVTKKGANYLQQVVIDFTMTLESTIKAYFLFITTLCSSSLPWLSSLCKPRLC